MSVCSPPPSHSHLPNAVVSNAVPEFRIPLQCPQNPKLHFELTNSLKLVASRHSSFRNRRFYLNCAGSETTFVAGQNGNFTVAEARVSEPRIDGSDGGNDGGDSGDSFGGGGRGGEGEGDGGDKGGEGDEFGPLLKFDEVMKESEARGVKLPQDMVEAAKATGLREVFLQRYLDLQGSVWPLGFLMKYCSMLRNRMLADPSFLFKVGTEIVIDSCCATFAEVQKRGKDFWAEFELYAADLLVGIVVDIALVGMLAPYARIGKPSVSGGLFGRLQHACAALPSSVFEAERPGCKFSVKQRVATYFYKGVLYGSVGFVCGLIGQGIANLIMNAKRSIKKSEEDVPVPPLVKSAALWGVFLAVSSNTRYQIVNGLEGLVEASPLAKRVPPVAMAFTIGVRFANNIYGGMQFVDWAKLSGVQ
ncbi:PREDICTED: protein RETICULATA-RELATED 1, chloroplastic [Prunus mume]|uniref:Protein RETICULATA-RELATED 1, chloroplastic n=1 Tax=Prunus mume TaxID=102107 RepID=A0ABM0NMK5_PRUMU|nr:PREDICTED: protein RETICULATA-RELATED 1, chloroplastic [Prunus mume]